MPSIYRTLFTYYRNFRLWGWKGVWSFIPQQLEKRRTLHHLMRYPRGRNAQPERGITLIAGFTGKISLNKVFRDLAFRLKDVGIPFQAYDPNPRYEIPKEEYQDILTPNSKFDLLKYDHIIDDLANPLPINLPATIKRSGVVFWEFDSGIIEGYPHILNASGIIGMSDFNVDYFRKVLPPSISVSKILYPFRFNPGEIPPSTVMRKRFGINESDFVIFFNFDLGTERKNPSGLLHAFAEAFPKHPNAKLVLKVMHVKQFPQALQQLHDLARDLNILSRLIIIEEYLPITDLYALTNACDVYASLHRGEGFGLGIAEAMSLGKAIVTSDCSATQEFCTNENALLVPCHETTFTGFRKGLPYRGVKTWYEPDCHMAARHFRRLYEDCAYCQQLGKRGKLALQEHFSNKNFETSIRAYMRD